MFDNNFHNSSSCAFAEQAVSFLYGETTAQEKLFFESHIQSCLICAEEFAGFDAVHNSVIEWKDLEFAALELPLIEIPYKDVGNFDKSNANSKVFIFRLPELGRLFSPFSIASALTVILFCIGITFLAFNVSNKSEIASLENKNSSPVFVSTEIDNQNAKTAQVSKGESKPAESSSIKSLKSVIKDVKEKYQPAAATPKPELKNAIVKVAVNSGKIGKSSNLPAYSRFRRSLNSEKMQATFAQAKKLPKLNNLVDDAEDKSLRLAELFDDAR